MLLTKGSTNLSLTESKEATIKSPRIRKRKLHDRQEVIIGISFIPALMRAIKRSGVKAWSRSTYFGKELIWYGKKYMFILKKNKKMLKHLFIFGLVKKDALKWLEKHPIKRPVPFLPSVYWNENAKMSKRSIIGIDLDGAYWHIARNSKIISANTFEHGLRIDNKMLCLATLSSLGADKRYQLIKDGQRTDDVEILAGSEQLKRIYLKIRHTCFTYMQQAAALVGDDFICYRTDCIYFYYSRKNVEAIENFFSSKGFDFKRVTDWDGVIEEEEN